MISLFSLSSAAQYVFDSAVKDVDIRLFDEQHKPVSNELFFHETNDPDNFADTPAKHFDGHQLKTKLTKKYLIVLFRIDEQYTGQFTITARTDVRANLILGSAFNTPCKGQPCTTPKPTDSFMKQMKRM